MKLRDGETQVSSCAIAKIPPTRKTTNGGRRGDSREELEERRRLVALELVGSKDLDTAVGLLEGESFLLASKKWGRRVGGGVEG